MRLSNQKILNDVYIGIANNKSLKVEKILKGSMDLIPSPSQNPKKSAKIAQNRGQDDLILSEIVFFTF